MYKGIKRNIVSHGNTNHATNWDWDMPSKQVRKAKRIARRVLRHRLNKISDYEERCV